MWGARHARSQLICLPLGGSACQASFNSRRMPDINMRGSSRETRCIARRVYADLSTTLFDDFDGILVAPGSPYKSLERTLAAIRYAREHGIPCFGTCGGFQHMLLEYARNVLGFQDAQHAEYDPYASNLFISQLACSLVGRRMELGFVPGSRVAAIYGAETAEKSITATLVSILIRCHSCAKSRMRTKVLAEQPEGCGCDVGSWASLAIWRGHSVNDLKSYRNIVTVAAPAS